MWDGRSLLLSLGSDREVKGVAYGFSSWEVGSVQGDVGVGCVAGVLMFDGMGSERRVGDALCR